MNQMDHRYETLSEALANCDRSDVCVAVWDTNGAIYNATCILQQYVCGWERRSYWHRETTGELKKYWETVPINPHGSWINGCDSEPRFRLCPKSFGDFTDKNTCKGHHHLYWKNDGMYM